jgi:glycosyltransferase involved in cell wall biosynthesis
MGTATLTIILPTYNRAAFLPAAFDSIRSQTFTDWELVVVDDGSTDETRALVDQFRAAVPQSVNYVYQNNQGAYGARNTGLDTTRGRYVAFFDSDDIWLEHHLANCVAALEANPDVDWAYGSCRAIDHATGRILAPSTFYIGDRRRPFLDLRSRGSGEFRVIEDSGATECMILHGLMCGLQNSVMRSRVFEGRRFDARFRNEAEDQLIVVRLLSAGGRFGYFDKVHVIYNEHAQNSSAAGSDRSLEKQLTIYRAEARGYEELSEQVRLTTAQCRALRRRLAKSYFWILGYNLLWQHGRRREALASFRRGLGYWPWALGCWKTYCLALARTLLDPRDQQLPGRKTIEGRYD